MVGADIVTSEELDVTFPATRRAPRYVRTLVELRLDEWGLARLAENVTLIASELVTNAVRHSAGQKIRVRFTREPHSVLLKVWDASDRMPVRREASNAATPDPTALDSGYPERTGGRGLPIVEMLAFRCGVSPTRPYGKWVWARVLT